MTERARPVLVYDGDCGFCTRCVRIVERLRCGADIVAWQHADLPSLGLTVSAARDAVQWVTPSGGTRAGHEAVAAALLSAGVIWRVLGRVTLLPGVSRLSARMYRLVSANRYRLPGGTPAGALPADQRPGAVPADQRPGAVPADQRPGAVPADQRPGAVPTDGGE